MHRLRVLIIALVLLPLSTFALAAGDPVKILANLSTWGGLTPRGAYHAELRIAENGTFEWYDQTRDETIAAAGQPGNPSGFNGWSKTALSPEDLAKLKEAIGAVDFGQLKLDTERRSPRASDGSESTLELASPAGKQTIPLWQLASPASLPVVELLHTLEARYARAGGPAPVKATSP